MKLFDRYPLLGIVIGILGISMSGILARLSTCPSALLAAYRLLCTLALMTPALVLNPVLRRELLHIPKKALLQSALSGILLAIHFTTWFESLKKTTVASATVIVCTEVLWVALGYCLFMKGKLSRKAVAAMLVTLLGSMMVAWSDAGQGSLYGDILALIAAVAVGGYTLLGRSVRTGTSTTVYTYIVYFFCALVLVVFSAFQHIPLSSGGMYNLSLGLALAVFSTLLGHSIFSWALKYFSPTFVSASKLCEPVFSSTAAVFLFGEIPGALQLLGALTILGGVIYYSVLESKGQS